MKSLRRWHQPESLSLESSSLSLWSTIPRLPRRIRLSLSLSISSTIPRLRRSLRRFRLPLDLLDTSAYLSISSTPPRISRSPRRLRVSLALRSFFCRNRSNVDFVSCVSFSYGRIKRLEVYSKKRSVVWTDEEAMSISACSLADNGATRPPGVKAAKARGKKQVTDGKYLDEFQKMWRIKQEDLVIKEKLSKMKLLDRLMAKQEPLDDGEEALKKKLINELLLSN
ncbi:hypothetical protein Bca52824_059823 [Brassica carinata]|uniref:No apical meristem-associated C-terminal domain-containing protein n=1 Tax=Brassica carinata TaxID=52824 RepID=A0A8X7QV32_BRACI|nr:hypothetical protein Bca52824_059823 [Brassica carinata]